MFNYCSEEKVFRFHPLIPPKEEKKWGHGGIFSRRRWREKEHWLHLVEGIHLTPIDLPFIHFAFFVTIPSKHHKDPCFQLQSNILRMPPDFISPTFPSRISGNSWSLTSESNTAKSLFGQHISPILFREHTQKTVQKPASELCPSSRTQTRHLFRYGISFQPIYSS